MLDDEVGHGLILKEAGPVIVALALKDRHRHRPAHRLVALLHEEGVVLRRHQRVDVPGVVIDRHLRLGERSEAVDGIMLFEFSGEFLFRHPILARSGFHPRVTR